MRTREQHRFDRSLTVLLLANALAITMAVLGKWSLAQMMWVYWGQSVIIGFFNWRRMLNLKDFSTKGLTSNNQPVPETEKGKKSTATFFLIHYGFFHFGYLVFLFAERKIFSTYDIVGVAACIIVFLFNHRYSYYYNLQQDARGKPNLGTMMFFPYARIIPMHMTIIFGSKFVGGSTGTLLLFLGLKTAADVVMHIIEHRMRPKGKA